MAHRFLLMTLFAAGAVSLAAQPGALPQEPLALINANVIGVADGAAQRGVTVVLRGGRIGVLGTVLTTMDPTIELIERTAARRESSAKVSPIFVEGAFQSLKGGNLADHDDRVRWGLEELIGLADLVVLAQASTARVAAAMTDFPLPILTSPASGLRRARERLVALEGER